MATGSLRQTMENKIQINKQMVYISGVPRGLGKSQSKIYMNQAVKNMEAKIKHENGMCLCSHDQTLHCHRLGARFFVFNQSWVIIR